MFEKAGKRGKGRIWLAGANQSYVVRSAHGLMARTCAGKGPLQAVALHERPVPVFPAVRGKRGSAAFSFGSHPFEAADG